MARATTRRMKAANASGWVSWAPCAEPGISITSASGSSSTRASMARRWCQIEAPPRPSTSGTRNAVTSKGALGAAQIGELGHEGGPVGLAVRASLIGEPVPSRIAHDASEEPLGEGGRVLVGDARGGPTGPPLEPGERRLVGADGADGVGSLDGGTEGDVAAEGVAHHHGGPVAHHRHEVGDVVGERAGDRHGARMVVAAPVVGDDVEFRQAAHGASERRPPVERSVHQHDRRGAGGGVPPVLDDAQAVGERAHLRIAGAEGARPAAMVVVMAQKANGWRGCGWARRCGH